jgi:hypothetical protein
MANFFMDDPCPFRATLLVTAYGIGKYLVKRLNMRGTERIEKTKLARIN